MRLQGVTGWWKWIFYLVLVGVVLGFVFAPGLKKISELEKRNFALNAEVKRLEIQNRRFENELTSLKNDPVYVEKVAREKFGRSKDGEVIYKIVE